MGASPSHAIFLALQELLNSKGKNKIRGNKGIGSTGTDLTFLSLDLDKRPLLELIIDGKKILGLIDTGTDKSIIAKKEWPASWLIQATLQTLQGLAYAKTPDMSARDLRWQDAEGHKDVMQP